MTSFSARNLGKTPNGYNKKDGGGRGQLPLPKITGFWGVAGFMPTEPGAWTYAWRDVIGCPVLEIVEGENGFTVTLDGDQIAELSGSHSDTKAWLDDKILEMWRGQADLAEAPLDWQPEIGPEIDVDLWMSRPQAAYRQSTPAVRGLARRHGISLELADEVMGGR